MNIFFSTNKSWGSIHSNWICKKRNKIKEITENIFSLDSEKNTNWASMLLRCYLIFAVSMSKLGANYIESMWSITAQKTNFSIKDFLSKCDQMTSFLRTWSHLLKKSLIDSFLNNVFVRYIFILQLHFHCH